MRRSARALIIKNKKLLLVTNSEVDVYWTPGGGIEENETPFEALKRELNEEIDVDLKSAKHYIKLTTKDFVSGKTLEMEFFLVKVSGRPTPKNEIEDLYWYTKRDFEEQEPIISPTVSTTVLPKLIEDGLL